MVDKLWMRCTSIQVADSLIHCAPNDHDCNVPAITVGSMCCRGPLDILEVESEAEDDVKGGPLDPHEVKNSREKEIKYMWDMEVYEYFNEAEARARTGRNPVGLKWIDTGKSQRFIWISCSWEVRRKGRRWRSWLQERQELCSLRWFRGRRRENGFAED